ncbi:hypothetical protein C8Q77DRAFT_93225 [Trametes polyzona]|nr:hypothetical protein C8Q77DRAFT_93225 [Trametes polyzona]
MQSSTARRWLYAVPSAACSVGLQRTPITHSKPASFAASVASGRVITLYMSIGSLVLERPHGRALFSQGLPPPSSITSIPIKPRTRVHETARICSTRLRTSISVWPDLAAMPSSIPELGRHFAISRIRKTGTLVPASLRKGPSVELSALRGTRWHPSCRSTDSHPAYCTRNLFITRAKAEHAHTAAAVRERSLRLREPSTTSTHRSPLRSYLRPAWHHPTLRPPSTCSAPFSLQRL